MMAIDAKSKVAANLLRFRFIDVFILIFGFPFRVMFVFAICSRKFGTKFPKIFETADLFGR